jgi:trans-aconitate 2-methyltransferase
MTEDWNARQYLKFEDERTRPPRDLLAQLPLRSPRRVIDLGCGPGNSTALLLERYPQAQVIGLDSSPDMLRQARERLPNCEFAQADLADWSPQERTDLLFANAVFQWVPDHPAVLRRLLAALRDDLPTPAAYYDLLGSLCAHLDIWHTVYNHVLADAEAIVEWFKGSGLRPFLSPLDDDMRRDFVADYTARIARAYPRQHDGRVLLRFPRLFIVATR